MTDIALKAATTSGCAAPAAPKPFHRSGLASRSELATDDFRAVFAALEADQEAFLRQEATFRSPEYSWPRDPLHNWSRVWEYPYVYEHLRRLPMPGAAPLVADVGSGVTFFPFALAKLGLDVICTDLDPICRRDIERAVECVPHRPGRVRFRSTDGARLPFEDMELDAAYCISVLEHVPDPCALVAEMARVLKPGAPFVVTIDLDLRGDAEIGPERHAMIAAALEREFEYAAPERTVHPADVLDTRRSPYPLAEQVAPMLTLYRAKERAKEILLARKRRTFFSPPVLTVHGFALRRRREVPA